MTGREVVDQALVAYKGMSLELLLLGYDHWPDFCEEAEADPEVEWVDYRGVRVTKAATFAEGFKYLTHG